MSRPNDPITLTVFSAKIKDLDGHRRRRHRWWPGQHLRRTRRPGRSASGWPTTPPTRSTAPRSQRRRRGDPVHRHADHRSSPTKTIRASFQIPSGTTVGVAAPIIITFAEPVEDKAAAQETFKLTTDKGEIQGSWGWLQDEDIQGTGVKQSIVHFRPAAYWPGVHQRARRGESAGRELRRRRLGQGGHRHRLHDRPIADRAGRREELPHGRAGRRQDHQELPGVLRQGVGARPRPPSAGSTW